MERDPDSMKITWENMNAYVPEARKPLLPCFKKAVSDDRRHIIQNGNLNHYHYQHYAQKK
jgi:hypothetical protein